MRKIIGVLMGAAMLVGMAAPASAATNNQRFTIVAKFSANGPTSCQVVATGPIQGTGTCTIDEVSNIVTIIHVMLPNGTVDIRAKETKSTDQFNEAACVDTFTFTENFRITGGTGAYAGASGSGTDTGQGVFTAPRTPQGCDENSGSGFVVANAIGHVNLGG
ncbi:MAG: hypothetical protein M3011_03870 [Actinomycetota bacterium]|nr:hypothetical protein [Actinomycetota bacterium]